MSHDIAYLHTAASHVGLFEDLQSQIAPSLSVRHIVDASLLEDAQAAGTIDDQLAGWIKRSMAEAASTGARVVVCTCSTIGGVAETAGNDRDFVSMRIDRAMASEAVRLGPRILVAATLPSTSAPSRELIHDSALRLGKRVDISELLIQHAWPFFERGQKEDYVQAIVDTLSDYPDRTDVIVLAQASMANVSVYGDDLGIPVLSSPRLGVKAAVQTFLDRTGSPI